MRRRRHVYRHHLFSRHVGANRHSRVRGATPARVRASPELQSRARAFIRRELQVFGWIARAELAGEYLFAIVNTVDLKGPSGAAQDMIADMLGRENAQVFCHELAAWLASPFKSLREWDACVQYGEVESPGEHEARSCKRRGRGRDAGGEALPGRG